MRKIPVFISLFFELAYIVILSLLGALRIILRAYFNYFLFGIPKIQKDKRNV